MQCWNKTLWLVKIVMDLEEPIRVFFATLKFVNDIGSRSRKENSTEVWNYFLMENAMTKTILISKLFRHTQKADKILTRKKSEAKGSNKVSEWVFTEPLRLQKMFKIKK